MNEIKKICICGGGSLGTVIAGVLLDKGYEVNILTGHPEKWSSSLDIIDNTDKHFRGDLSIISNEPLKVIPGAQVILLCFPGYLIRDELIKIEPYITSSMFVGTVFSSTGFFFEALDVLRPSISLWGFQRVPFIARVKEYGKSAFLLGYKDNYAIGVERASIEKAETLRKWVEDAFGCPTRLLSNYLEASITNSNPLLHTSRLYTMFHDWLPSVKYDHHSFFYGEWTNEASALLIEMDKELFGIVNKLPVKKDFLLPILDYYESHDSYSLTKKIRSIESFKLIKSPMIDVDGGWIPDFSNRYFTEDFTYGLRYICKLADDYNVEVPLMKNVLAWGLNLVIPNV